ncbi:hypothetical protein [Salinisphaera sp.]|uniref:hypothetical protein n=1 Tax=Salinisphaera sp. TaxID=1914330 RepID=UPI000C49F85D|nr:hypothetical protein [Salinisphaera sp.]MAS09920.1 hypothetical protein [Salinisphaera sp.]|tara:strand:+ start:242 stop:829 length:588 start_codon:yes stop_codon:yes gene_type:complete
MQDHDWHSIAEGKSDDGCIPQFYMRAVEAKAQSRIEGRPIYVDKPYVKILIPGQKNSVPDRPVRPDDKHRWPQQWSRFEQSREQVQGTPIEEWPYLGQARVAELRALNIRTVEQIAELPDGSVTKLGPDGRDLVERAKNHLQGDDETIKALRSELEQLESEHEQLKRDHESLKALCADQGVDLNQSKGGGKNRKK